MSFSQNTLLKAVFVLGTVAIVIQQAQACPPRGGSYRGGGYSNYSTPSYGGYNSYSTPSYSYSQPSYGTTYSQPIQFAQPVQQQSPVQPFVQQPQQQTPQQQQFAQQPQQPRVAQQPQTPQQVALQPQTPQRQTPTQNNNAAMSALRALGGFAPPQTTAPQPQQQQIQTPAHVGTWTATLGNGSTVRLVLQNDGNFSWVATNKAGNSSSFSGTYTVGNGSLNLNRSNDGQTLGGSMTNSSNKGFSFKVAGNNAASINFVRG